MNTQKGIGMVKLIIFIVAMMLLLGVTTYVVMQDNGIYEREIEPLIENNIESTNTVVEK